LNKKLDFSVNQRKGFFRTSDGSKGNPFRLAAVASAIDGAALLGANAYGFTEYFTTPSGWGGWATVGMLNRLSLIFLVVLAVSLGVSGSGFMRLGKLKGDRLSSHKFSLTVITSAVLFVVTVLVSTADNAYFDGGIGPYWWLCFFKNMETSYAFSWLTIIAIVLLGITQNLWGRTLVKPVGPLRRSKLQLIAGASQIFSGVAFLVAAATQIIMFPIFPIVSLFFPALAVLFLITQILSAAFFLQIPQTETNPLAYPSPLESNDEVPPNTQHQNRPANAWSQEARNYGLVHSAH
jgi:hypothetical protein